MPRERKPFSVQKIRDIGATARMLGAEAEEFADFLAQEQFTGELWVDAGDRLDEGLIALRKWISKLRDAHRNAKLPYMPDAEPAEKPAANGTPKRKPKG